MAKTYLGYDEQLKADVYWMPDGWRKYKYRDGRVEIVGWKKGKI